MTREPDSPRNPPGPAGLGTDPDALLHDLKQPLNAIRVIAQELRLDVSKNRLDIESMPQRLKEIEKSVDELVKRIDLLRGVVETKE